MAKTTQPTQNSDDRPKSKVIEAMSLRDRLAHELRLIRGGWIGSIIEAGEKTQPEEDLLIPFDYWYPISYQRHSPFYILDESEKTEDLELADRILKVFKELGVETGV